MYKVFDSRDIDYRSPFGAVPQGVDVTITLRPLRVWGFNRVTLMLWDDLRRAMIAIPMEWLSLRGSQDVYRAVIRTGELLGPLWYHFKMERTDGSFSFYGNNERCRGGEGKQYADTPPGYQLTVYLPEYTVPEWYGSGVTYQIFPDRFCAAGRVSVKGMIGGRRLHDDWNDLPDHRPDSNGEVKNNDFFGGNIAGIRSKLGYLQEMGVTTIYLNPIFEAASNHRYDTADYLAIDPMLGSREDFTALCHDARERGIRVILDGVFNHTGFDSRYFGGRGSYAEQGAYQSRDSKYYKWFSFGHWPQEYESWWGIYTLPRVRSHSREFMDFIAKGKHSVIREWLRLGASGWRLDVADELTDEFIEEIRRALREECPDGILIGEVWEDASNKIAYDQRRKYLLGRGLDSVMNYPFRNALLEFLRGGEARDFVEEMECLRENYPKNTFNSLMNLIGTHDSPRALTVLGGDPAYEGLSKDEKAGLKLSPSRRSIGLSLLRLAAAIQFSFPGSPLVYYGDEAGMEGYEDPFNRGGYPWGHEDKGLIEWYRRLGNARRNSEALRQGEIRWLFADGGMLVYERASANETIVIAVNRSLQRHSCDLPWYKMSANDLMTGATLRTTGGVLHLELEPLTVLFLM